MTVYASTLILRKLTCPEKLLINCSKFITEGLQQWSRMTLLVSLFVTLRNLLFGKFLSRRSVTTFVKNSRKFQASATERCFLSEVGPGKVKLFFCLKIFTQKRQFALHDKLIE